MAGFNLFPDAATGPDPNNSGYAANAALPPVYQAQVDALRQRQMLASMLFQRASTPIQPQQIGPVAARISPLAGIAQALATGGSGYLLNDLSGQESAIRQNFATDQQKAVNDLVTGATNPDVPTQGSAITAGFGSPFPQVQALAKALQTQREHRNLAMGQIYGEAGNTPQAIAAVSGNVVPPIAPRPGPIVTFTPDPNDTSGVRQIPIVQNTDKNGVVTGVPATGGTNVNLPSNLATDQNAQNVAALATAQAHAKSAMTTLAQNQHIVQDLQEGADTGGGADFRQQARQFAAAFGINFPATGPTTALQQQLYEKIKSDAKDFGGQPSNTEDNYVRLLVGTLTTDPTAMPKLLAYTNAGALKALQDYGSYVDTAKAGAAARQSPGLYDSAMIGIRQPSTLFGPQDLQMKTIEALQQAGGDITKFVDRSGGPFPADSKFDIKVAPITPNTPDAGTPLPTTPALVEGTTGTYQGHPVIVKDGKWVVQ